jgi:hypothetical protein
MATFDLPGYSRLWRDRFGRFSNVTREGREELAEQVQAISRAALEKLVYSKPEEVSSTGRKLWTRTRDLINHEKAEVRGGGDVVLTNDMVYAEPRHEAGKPGRRKINPARVAHWRELIQPEIRQAQLETAAKKILQLLVRR